MTNTILVRRPTAAPAGEVRAPVFDLQRPIAGVHVGIRTDGAWRSWRLIAQVWDEYFTRAELRELLETAYRRFYWRPTFVARNLVQIRSPKDFMRKATAGLRMLTA